MKQESGNDSTNIQAGGNVTIGITYIEAKDIALEVFKSNFYTLTQSAAQTAKERAEEMSDEILNKIFEKIPHHIEKLKEPAVQSSLFNAQKEYAKTGDKELEAQLINLLIERISSDERSLKQIVLDEVLSVLPKLTINQINLLTVIFSAYNLNHSGINTINAFENFFIKKLVKFFPVDMTNYSFFTHLQYCGCYVNENGIPAYVTLEEDFAYRFRGLFSTGFNKNEFELETNHMDINSLGDLIVPCLRNPDCYQFNSLNDNSFKTNLKVLNLSVEKEKLLFSLWHNTTMSTDQISQIVSQLHPKASYISFAWKIHRISLMRLTSVGYAIAISNYNNKTGENINYQNFI